MPRIDQTKLALRPAQPDDAVALEHLAGRVFTSTYGPRLSPETLRHHLETELCTHVFRCELLESRSAYWVAQLEGELIGFIKLERTALPACVPSKNAIELLKLYVDTDHHSLGAGSRLLETALGSLSPDLEVIWLLVWEENPRAIAFYRKHGFEPIGRQDVLVGETAFHDLVMIKSRGAHD